MATPRDQIVQYSTQMALSTNTAPTYVQLLGDIDYTFNNVVPSSDKIRWMNDTVKQLWKYMATTKLYTTTSVADRALYPMSTDMRFEKISYVGMSDSTARSSTELYTEYEPAGMEDELTGSRYYKAGAAIGLYPVPTSNEESRAIKALYEPVPPVFSSTTDTTTVPLLSNDYLDAVKYGTLKRIASAGNNPDVEMANNFDAEYREIMGKAKMDYYKRQQKTGGDRYSRDQHNWNG